MYKNTIKSNYSIKMENSSNFIAEIKPGEKVKVETINAFGDHFENLNDLLDLIGNKYGDKHHHPLTGPIKVIGAKKGDVLKVDILKITTERMAQCLSKSAGVSPIDIDYFAERAPIISDYEKDKDLIYYGHGMYMKYKPMIGIIGLAPKDGFLKTGHASNIGGNLDLPIITEGVSVYIPVENDDAYLYLGDVHGAQGYGELGGVALEASAIVDIQVEILKPREEQDYIFVTGKDPYSSKNVLGVVGVAKKYENLNEAIKDSYYNATNIMLKIFPSFNKATICNLLTILGNSMNGQALSKTSESTCIVNILEEDLKQVKNDPSFAVSDIEFILFKKEVSCE